MSETSTIVNQVPKPSVERNGVVWTAFEEGKFGKLSPLVGQPFWFPSVGKDQEERNQYIQWYGADDFWSNSQTDARRDFADLYTDHLENHGGIFNQEDFQKEMEEFTSGRQSLAKIKEEIEMLGEQQYETVKDDTLSLEEMKSKVTAIRLKIDPLREKKAKLQAQYQARADKRAATKTTNEAKAKGQLVS